MDINNMKTTIDAESKKTTIDIDATIALFDEEAINKFKRCEVLLTRCDHLIVNTASEKSPQLRRSSRKKQVESESVLSSPKKEIKEKRVQIITPIQMCNILWLELSTKNYEAKVGMIVCAKMATFWPWPAQVIKITRKKARVKFFGDLREGSVDIIQCVPYPKCHNLIFNYLKSIDEAKRKLWISDLFKTLDPASRRIHDHPLKRLFIQAVRDVEIYLEFDTSMLNFI